MLDLRDADTAPPLLSTRTARSVGRAAAPPPCLTAAAAVMALIMHCTVIIVVSVIRARSASEAAAAAAEHRQNIERRPAGLHRHQPMLTIATWLHRELRIARVKSRKLEHFVGHVSRAQLAFRRHHARSNSARHRAARRVNVNNGSTI